MRLVPCRIFRWWPAAAKRRAMVTTSSPRCWQGRSRTMRLCSGRFLVRLSASPHLAMKSKRCAGPTIPNMVLPRRYGLAMSAERTGSAPACSMAVPGSIRILCWLAKCRMAGRSSPATARICRCMAWRIIRPSVMWWSSTGRGWVIQISLLIVTIAKNVKTEACVYENILKPLQELSHDECRR